MWILKVRLDGEHDVFPSSLVSHVSLRSYLFYVQAWGRRRASSPLYLEVWDPWLWQCSWRTLSKQPRTFCCIPQKGSAWRLHPNGPTKTQQWHIPAFPPPYQYIYIYFSFFYSEQPDELPQVPLHTDLKDDSFKALSLTSPNFKSSHV